MWSKTAACRTLDSEMNAVIFQVDKDFDWTKLPSVYDLAGKVAEDYIQSRQEGLSTARKTANAASFEELKCIAQL